jgi:hypothetical protein
MIIFGSILTPFESNSILEVAQAVLKIGLSLNPNHHREIKLPKSKKRSVVIAAGGE